EQGFFFKTPAGSNGPLPMKFIDLKQRLADMDQQGIAVQALSLTTPMVYWAEPDVSAKLARAWNDGAVEAHKAHPDRFVVLATLPGNPIHTPIAASRLIFGGVLDKQPRLQICLPHAGGILPILIGRIDHGWKVRKENRHLANAPSSYLRRFTYDTIAHSKPIME